MQEVKQFLNNHFKSLELRPGLFYEWPYSLRFEISKPFGDELEQAFYRSTKLFNEVFDESDQILVVSNVHSAKEGTYLQRKPLNVYRKYIKNQKLCYKLQYQLLSGAWDEVDVCHQFTLACQKNDIRYVQLLKAICYEDFRRPSTILKGDSRLSYDIYFMNLSKKLIFHLYDDRGCDVLASEVESIKCLYQKYDEWLLDYDRTEMNRMFGSR